MNGPIWAVRRWQGCLSRAAYLIWVVSLTGCTVKLLDLNLTPTPYTSVVRVALVTDDGPQAKAVFGGLVRDATVTFRDKQDGKLLSFPVRSNLVRAQLGLGTYQILDISFMNKEDRLERFDVSFVDTGTKKNKATIGTFTASFVHIDKVSQVEARIEFSVVSGDLGKEVDFGSFNPATGNVTGDRLRLME